MKEVLNKIIKFITSKGVKKFFAREVLILLLGLVVFLILTNYYSQVDEEPWLYPLLLLYVTRLLYLLYRFVRWCFRVVFFDK